jgi:zinc D-Ala-D-Ala carboxypeptidase
MHLSKHVTVEEFEQSNTATRKGINNKMSNEQTNNASRLCINVFEPLREALGNKPIQISSGFRSIALNKRIGGSSTSQHCKGEAMDLKIDSKGFFYIKDNLNFDQLIWEFGTTDQPSWVHVSHSTNNRKQVLRAIKSGGKTKYLPFK